MLPEKIELVRETCARWSRGDLDGTLQLIDPDATWQPSGRFIDSGGVYEGHAGVQEFWELFREPWDEIELEPVEFTELDPNRLLTRVRFRGTGRASGVVTETELFVVWTTANGRVTGYQSFGNREQALAAVDADV
jgi:ketosteroid isomerase-like protein